MKHTSADPKTKWAGFHRYRRYWLNNEKVLSLPLKRRVDGKTAPSTVGEVYKSLESRHFEGGKTTEALSAILAGLGIYGQSFPDQVLEILLTLRNKGVPPFGAQWFFYDHRSGNESPAEYYTFFVAYDGKIVSEEVCFQDSPESGFDPSVLESGDDSFIGSERGIAQIWYRRFYNETYIGQALLLSSPMLRWKFDANVKTHALLWVLIALTSLVFIRLWM